MSTEKPTAKHHRGATVICDLLRRIEWLDNTGCKGYKILSESSMSAGNFLESRAKVQSKPDVSLSAAVIVVALQDGILTERQWEDEIRTIHYDKDKWSAAIDLLFERIFNRLPDRSKTAIGQEAALAWSCIKLPFTEEQLQYLKRANDYRREHNRDRGFNSKDGNAFYLKSLSFDDPRFTGEPIQDGVAQPPTEQEEDAQGAKQDDTPSRLLAVLLGLLLRAGGARDDDERYGYGCKMPKGKKKEKEIIDPEEVAHVNQDRIDAAFAELMASVNWGEL